jgi:glyoxylase-like metal-dependent hydrolase (beta-lactamase superfamily II)
MTVQDDVDRLIDERPGKELLVPRYDDPAKRLSDVILRSGGTTASYLLLAGTAGRVIVNCGLGYEAPHHKRVFDAVCPGPTPYIITTQAHVDHVGGVALFREPTTRYVAQADNLACQRDDERIARFRMRTAGVWFDMTGADAIRIAKENPGVVSRQDKPVPDIKFSERLSLKVGGLPIECISVPGGETIDSTIIWLPEQRTALISNILGPLFPHFPNFNTLRGDRYRWVEPYLQSVLTLRDLHPAMLVTGRHEPIVGEELIEASLTRLHDAVDFVHTETVAGINAGKDPDRLMREIALPPHLRVGQGYGKVAWAVRTIWETYIGWFKLRSTTELYPSVADEAFTELVALSGADAVIQRGRELVDRGEPAAAIHLGEAVLRHDPDAGSATHLAAAALMAEAHQRLLDTGGVSNFWESGWLEAQRDRWQQVSVGS